MVAVRIKQMQSFMGVMQMIVMPMFFISGALFPVANLPGWLAVLNRLDPLTYAVDPMRRLVFNNLSISPQARAALDPGVTWFGWHVPALLEAGMIVALGLVMLGIAIWEFSTTEYRAAAPPSGRRQLRPGRAPAPGYALAGAGSSTRRGSSVSRAITSR
jgi:ABC-2 type transport system permease protein